MLALMFFLLGCVSDHLLAYEIAKEEKEVVYAQDVYVTITYEVIEEVTIIEDTAFDGAPIWVDSFTQPQSVNGVDIIWVIDPSGSMNQHQQRVLDGIGAMMQALPPNGWRLVIIPADYRFSEQEQQFPLVPGDSATMAENMYQLAKKGSFEAGFDAVYGYIMNNTYSNTWMRQDAALLVVFVSDEKEQSNVYLNSTQNFISWYSSLRNNVYVASIVNQPTQQSECNAPSSLTGSEYIYAATHFGGQVVDICSEDWTAGVTDASNQIEPHEEWELSFEPADPSHIYIFYDGVPQPDTDGVDLFWHYESSSNKIIFDKVPQANVLVEIAYYYEDLDTGN